MEKSKLNVCQEWLFSKKEPVYDEFELNFVLSGFSSESENCQNLGDIEDDLYGEDKDDSAANAYWNYTDEVYDFLYYKNPDDATWGADGIESLLANLDYFFNNGEKAAVKNFKSNMNKKTKPYIFTLDQRMNNKRKFVSCLTDPLDKVVWDINSIANRAIDDLKDENKSSGHVYTKKTILVNKINYFIKEVENLANALFDKITKSPKKSIAQEGILDLFKKKEQEKPVSKWNFYTLFIYVKFYNKNFINLYKKAGKEYADIVKKMVAKYYKYKDYNVPGYDKARAEFEKEVKGLCEKLLVNNKPLFDKTRNILKGVCDGIDKVKYPLAASAWVNDGEYNPEAKGEIYLHLYTLSEIGTDSNIYSVWGEEYSQDIKFKTIPATTQKVILNQLLKEVKDVVEPETDVYVPTGNYVEAYDSGKYGDYEDGIPNDIVPNMLYTIDDQGEYLPAPDVDKTELEAAIQQCLDGLEVSQEEYNIATEMTLGEHLKSSFSLTGDRGTINASYTDGNTRYVINTIRDEIMPKLFKAYYDVRHQIAEKFFGHLPKDIYTYAKEIAKRRLDLKEKVWNAIGSMTDADLQKAKKGLESIKRKKYDDIPNSMYEWVNNITLQAKYEYEVNSSCEVVDIMLIVKFLRDYTNSTIKNHQGATYGKVLKDLKDWMSKNVVITYEKDGNVIKTLKI